MANAGTLTVEVKAELTVDNDTAMVCLGLLELYCRQNKKTIEARNRIIADSTETEVVFDFIADKNCRRNEVENAD